MSDAAQASNVAFIVIASIQLLFTSGVFIWLIKKITSMSERLATMEAVFDYVKTDHDDAIETRVKQTGLQKDINACFEKIRSLENQTSH